MCQLSKRGVRNLLADKIYPKVNCLDDSTWSLENRGASGCGTRGRNAKAIFDAAIKVVIKPPQKQKEKKKKQSRGCLMLLSFKPKAHAPPDTTIPMFLHLEIPFSQQDQVTLLLMGYPTLHLPQRRSGYYIDSFYRVKSSLDLYGFLQLCMKKQTVV
ncbi:hypothetical protein V6N13_041924 [Hibiscus sabdariffa]